MEREETVSWSSMDPSWSRLFEPAVFPVCSHTVSLQCSLRWMHGASPRSAHLSRVEIVLQLCSIALGEVRGRSSRLHTVSLTLVAEPLTSP